MRTSNQNNFEGESGSGRDREPTNFDSQLDRQGGGEPAAGDPRPVESSEDPRPSKSDESKSSDRDLGGPGSLDPSDEPPSEGEPLNKGKPLKKGDICRSGPAATETGAAETGGFEADGSEIPRPAAEGPAEPITPPQTKRHEAEERPGGGLGPEGRASSSSEAGEDEATECPSCGRHFKGNHCPSCGLEVGRPQSILGVASTLLQELIDVQRGLWPTIKALATRPGAALREHLGTGPRPLMNPGRYLLAAIVVNFGTVRALTWLGMREGGAQKMTSELEETEAKAAELGIEEEQALSLLSTLASDIQSALASQTYYVASSLLLAALLALTVWRLFGAQIDRGAQAFSFSLFTVGQSVFLETALVFIYVPVAFLVTGAPVDLDASVGAAIAVLYVTTAIWRTFGPGLRAAGKGALATIWATVEQALISTSAVACYSLWLLHSHMAGQGSGPTSSTTLRIGEAGPSLLPVGMSFSVMLIVVPLVLHLGLEVYYRSR